jgi:hypothetical protein
MSLLSKESLELITGLSEVLAVALTVLGALSGLVYVLASKPLKRIETAERLTERQSHESAMAVLAGNVSAANLKASLADKAAGDANKAAGLAHDAAGKANERAGSLEKDAAKARAETEKLHQQNLATELKLEEEKKSRRELEKSMTPRVLPIVSLEGGKKTNFDSLRPFAEMQAIIEYIPNDAEARRASGEIGNILQMAGWKIVRFGPNPMASVNGVLVLRYAAPDPTVAASWDDERRSSDAADALVAFLESNDWGASQNSAGRKAFTIPPNTVQILVGIKPMPFFDAKWNKQVEEMINEIRKTIPAGTPPK